MRGIIYKEDRRRAIILLTAAALMLIGMIFSEIGVHLLYPRRYSEMIAENCAEFGVDESLVYAVIRTESGFDDHACSDVGALGLMQIMPETFSWLQTRLKPEQPMSADALLLPEVNIRYGVYYLSRLRNSFGSDTLTIAAYHAGQGSVSEWLEQSGEQPEGFSRDDIRSAATRHYVDKVERAREVYIKLYFSR